MKHDESAPPASADQWPDEERGAGTHSTPQLPESHPIVAESRTEQGATGVAASTVVPSDVWDRLAAVPAPERVGETPIATEAERASRVLHARNQQPFATPAQPRILTVSNQKGGVGKTTTTVNLAVALAMHGARVMVIDSDPQGNASTALGTAHGSGTPSIYDVLLGDSDLADVAVPHESIEGLWCVPATIDLAGAEIELVSVVARESRLRTAIEAHLRDLGASAPHYVLIDCPPSLGLLTVNALVAAAEVLIPIQCEYYALEGLGQLLSSIELIRAHLNESLAVSTILLTMYDARTRLADQVADEVRSHFGDVVLSSVIPRSVRVSEAPGYGQSVLTYDPGSRGAVGYVEAAREIATRGAPGGAPVLDETSGQAESDRPAGGDPGHGASSARQEQS